MLKKVDSSQLRVGMFIHELDCGWMEHPFVRNRFKLSKDEEIRKILAAGIRYVVIDSGKGLDVADAPTLSETQASIEAELTAVVIERTTASRTTLREEMGRAATVRQEACGLVRTVMQDARLGKAVELDQVTPIVENIVDSILGNAGALISLSRIKHKDEYTLLHSASVCTLLVAFCSARGMDKETIYQAGIGGLLHDTGKALVPDAILNKPGRLTDDEFAIVKRHPSDGYNILRMTPGIGPIPLDITLHHHERCDGSGYPDQQDEHAISELAQMAAIVDVYDAITAERCYHKAMPAAEALRKIFEWSKFHFNPGLVQEFIRCIGIYPVGSLVRLESGRLGVVIEPHETSLLSPKVNAFYDTKNRSLIPMQIVDLSRPVGSGGADRIVGLEQAEKWQLDPMQYLCSA